jgi:hypothetical protein
MHARLSDILADMRFRTTVELGGKTATGLPVPVAVVAALGAGKSRQSRSGSATTHTEQPSHRWVVDTWSRSARRIAPPPESPQVTKSTSTSRSIPRHALANDDEARQFFDTLAYTHPKECVRWIEEAEKADTRRARIAKATEALRAGKRTR